MTTHRTYDPTPPDIVAELAQSVERILVVETKLSLMQQQLIDLSTEVSKLRDTPLGPVYGGTE